MNNNNNNFKIEEYERKVAYMFAQSVIETERVEQLNLDQSAIRADVKALSRLPNPFLKNVTRGYTTMTSISYQSPGLGSICGVEL